MKLTENRLTLLSSQSSGDEDPALPYGRSSYASSTVSSQAGSGRSSGSIVLPHSHSTIASSRAMASSSAIASGSAVASSTAIPPYSYSAVASASGSAMV